MTTGQTWLLALGSGIALILIVACTQPGEASDGGEETVGKKTSFALEGSVYDNAPSSPLSPASSETSGWCAADPTLDELWRLLHESERELAHEFLDWLGE